MIPEVVKSVNHKQCIEPGVRKPFKTLPSAFNLCTPVYETNLCDRLFKLSQLGIIISCISQKIEKLIVFTPKLDEIKNSSHFLTL